jgi:ribosomal RNA assembly protein
MQFDNPEEDISRFYLKIPHDRIGALIGPNGSIKKRLEEEAGVNLDIDSESGQVVISSEVSNEDPFLVIKARDFVKAVGRGFNPEAAFRLLQEDIYFDYISLTHYVGDNPRKLNRIRGRIIGRDGRTREIIQQTTGVSIVIYGKTISFIGTYTI